MALASAAGCKSGTETSVDVQSFITALAASNGTAAVFHSGSPPSQGSGPTVTASGSTAFVPGGSAFRTITGTAAFGSFTASGDTGGQGSGTQVATFTY